jgi:hypothetical protein
MKSIIKGLLFFVILLCCTITIVPLWCLILQAMDDEEGNLIYKLFKEI